MSKAGHLHLILLIILVALSVVSFYMPEDVALVMIVGLGVLYFLVVISHINLQYYQKCPRCESHIVRTQGSCVHCGLEFHASESSTAGEGWDQ